VQVSAEITSPAKGASNRMVTRRFSAVFSPFLVMVSGIPSPRGPSQILYGEIPRAISWSQTARTRCMERAKLCCDAPERSAWPDINYFYLGAPRGARADIEHVTGMSIQNGTIMGELYSKTLCR